VHRPRITISRPDDGETTGCASRDLSPDLADVGYSSLT
jgi:hypothetical protein